MLTSDVRVDTIIVAFNTGFREEGFGQYFFDGYQN
jgi:hypothetical protein